MALEKVKARCPRLSLDSLGIKAGDTLTCSRDEALTATVVSGGKVDFQGEVLSLSAAALKALHGVGYKTSAASGSKYWMFDGELLNERRRNVELDQFCKII
ncbi:hypothetical protein [Synechococcus elongatus]|uniref:hypothetical protein n=1 Tax=Synechococcus elongatus TaxID=32046 RepID=UPI000F7EEC93|nr:hypothetical protein [Synechococcus elongatus]MBD2588393.1 hypothetical protein [Synechococcus elongatus FACHB-242]MBD2689444.1 hypothetical protein [Synechococcus elongatus FACHB-1061]MBD2708137.1 hypothetical protein [Synechococcus elongatus PCC 7942 = FACHB-805]WKW04553.1 hypothetical protein QY054_08110 [Synechococcus elongatus PCC 7942 = FACHB-805]